jgi:hypothetical protein
MLNATVANAIRLLFGVAINARIVSEIVKICVNCHAKYHSRFASMDRNNARL